MSDLRACRSCKPVPLDEHGKRDTRKTIHDRCPKSEGIARDISPLDAFIHSFACPPVGALAEIETVLFCAGNWYGTADQGEARVIRVARPSNKDRAIAFAVFRVGANQWDHHLMIRTH